LGNHGVKKVIEFCYGHRLLNYDGKCRNLHGHNGQIEIEMNASALDALGMVIDFGDINDIAKGWVDTHLDHKMLLHRHDPIAKVLKDYGEQLYLMDGNPTAENIAKLIFRELRALGLQVSRVSLWETPSACAIYSED
jgi:6-pyruvoyltetrahydropterin/6-carboxytetrahydropterin synthase